MIPSCTPNPKFTLLVMGKSISVEVGTGWWSGHKILCEMRASRFSMTIVMLLTSSRFIHIAQRTRLTILSFKLTIRNMVTNPFMMMMKKGQRKVIDTMQAFLRKTVMSNVCLVVKSFPKLIVFCLDPRKAQKVSFLCRVTTISQAIRVTKLLELHGRHLGSSPKRITFLVLNFLLLMLNSAKTQPPGDIR